MATYKSDLLNTLEQRGLLYQGTDLEELDKRASTETLVGYCGYDPTASSLHIGNLVTIMMLYWFQQTGHKPITLMGGATGLIGDPSFRDSSKPMISAETANENIESIKGIFANILTYGDGPTDAMMVNNIDWFKNIGYIEFLRDYGAHFSVNRMLSFDSVKLRLEREQSMSFLEFNYMLFQAYDFLELNRNHNCTVQFSGSDQWGNIVNGVDLTRRKDSKTVFGVTAPLITDSNGKKMGKSDGNAFWLNPDKLSHLDYYQFWRNCDDADTGKLLRIFTPLPLDEIARLEKLEGAEINEAKKILAFEATKLVRGETAATQSAATALETFSGGGKSDGLPTINVAESDLDIPYFELFVRAGLTKTNGEARRLIKGGGARINDVAISDEGQRPSPSDIDSDGVIKLSAGKKRHALVKVS